MDFEDIWKKDFSKFWLVISNVKLFKVNPFLIKDIILKIIDVSEEVLKKSETVSAACVSSILEASNSLLLPDCVNFLNPIPVKWVSNWLPFSFYLRHDFCSISEQCCNKDWKWTEDEYEDSLVSENRPKTNTKNLH